MKTEKILDVNIAVIDREGLLAYIDECAERNRTALISNVNAHAMNLAYGNSSFREVLNRSTVVFCDGYGVKLMARLTGKRLGERMTPPDWIDELFALCARQGYKVYFIGDEEHVVNAFVSKVSANHPDLIVTGYRNGFFPLGGEEDARSVEDIKRTDTDIIITGMGMPRQEIWANAASITTGKGVFIATGAMFRWYSGFEKRAPRWITDHGLEWLARLCAHPIRNFRRYVIGIPMFMWRIFSWKVRHRS